MSPAVNRATGPDWSRGELLLALDPPPGSDLAWLMICMGKTAKTGLFLALAPHFWG
jgi:hypothetical protein